MEAEAISTYSQIPRMGFRDSVFRECVETRRFSGGVCEGEGVRPRDLYKGHSRQILRRGIQLCIPQVVG